MRKTLALLLLPAAAAAPAAAETDLPPTFQEKTSEALSKLQPLIDAKRWDQAIALLEGALVGTPADSYDRSFLTDIDAKIRMAYQNDIAGAIPRLEEVVNLAKTHPNYLKESDRIDHLSYLAHGYFQLASGIKNHPAEQQEDYRLAIDWLGRYLASAKQPNPDDRYLYAVLLYQRANLADGKIDRDGMNAALAATLTSLTTQFHPKLENYQLLAAESIALDDYPSAAEYFELELQLRPAQKDVWANLFVAYNNLAANSEKNPRQQRRYWARAINTLERAQALGYLKEKHDYANLVTLYYQASQYGRAIVIMQGGLRDGRIEDKPENWISLAYFYTQVGKEIEALNTLKEATRHFPDDSDLYFEIARDYAEDVGGQQSYDWYKRAVEHHNFHQQKEYTGLYFYAYAAFELQKYEEAHGALRRALTMKGSPTAELQSLLKAVEDAIAARDKNRHAH